MSISEENGILQWLTSVSVDEVVERLLSILRAKAITVFVVADHSGEAAKMGPGDAKHQAHSLWKTKVAETSL